VSTKIKRAIVSVSDKRGLSELCRALVAHGIEIISTGGTARALAGSGVATTQVADYTGAPEILGGRVKTLHPKVHGGILGRNTGTHASEMAAHGIEPIDLVVINLYPFTRTVAAPDVTWAEAIENIDIGGPAMIRSAAKNHERVAVVVDPDEYGAIVAELADSAGALTAATRLRLARKAFAHTAAYDAAIAAFMASATPPSSMAPVATVQSGAQSAAQSDTVSGALPDTLITQWQRVLDLRYGENPHQTAGFYAGAPLAGSGARPSVARAQVLQGKPLSYNNILDLDAALACVLEFSVPAVVPAVVIVKHTNPCGVAVDKAGVHFAYERARATDPASSFGGIVAVNQPVDEELADLLAQTFLECVIAPEYTERARERLAAKKNLRLLATGAMCASPTDADWTMRSVAGGLLLQTADYHVQAARDARVVSARAPSDDELDALDFIWRVVKHVKSNAIVLGRGTETAGIGAGQMSRVDAARLAVQKCAGLDTAKALCAASDAFFPFRDGIDMLAEANVTAVIQPGGSIRDEEVIAAADEHGMAMVFTGMRHFRH
jgi:phosphoribosylaminoimidazolecarboxamide formyltransferase/IMP cyclohydrolase